jgi:hypothetical protein
VATVHSDRKGLRSRKMSAIDYSKWILKLRLAWQAPDRQQRIMGFLLSALLFRMHSSLRKHIFSGTEHYCPICRSQISHFLVLQRSYHLFCPICHSLQRERLGWILLNSAYIPSDGSIKRLLHIAPEPSLANYLQSEYAPWYFSADLQHKGVMIQLDVTNMPFQDNIYDLIYCSHVLEHVRDDRLAMRELQRILSPNGIAVIIVPIFNERTLEDPEVNEPLERERLFGQYDHVRVYGPDVIDRLSHAGFMVNTVYAEDLVTPEEIRRMGLTAGERILVCHTSLNSLPIEKVSIENKRVTR